MVTAALLLLRLFLWGRPFKQQKPKEHIGARYFVGRQGVIYKKEWGKKVRIKIEEI